MREILYAGGNDSECGTDIDDGCYDGYEAEAPSIDDDDDRQSVLFGGQRKYGKLPGRYCSRPNFGQQHRRRDERHPRSMHE